MTNQEIFEQIKNKGYCFIDSFLTENEVEIIQTELLSLYQTIPDYSTLYDNRISENEYPYGKSMRFGGFNFIPNFKDIFLSKNFSNITKSYLGPHCQENLQTFTSFEYKKSTEADGKPRNSYWHFDPWRALKYFFYLEDVDLSNGCLRVMEDTLSISKDIRNKYPLQEIVDKYYIVEDLIDDNKVINFEGKRGSMIVFDTDLFHVGSNILDDNKKRMIITVHNRNN